jgi:hypothetical protein
MKMDLQQFDKSVDRIQADGIALTAAGSIR